MNNDVSDAVETSTDKGERRSVKFTKTRALLAGGLVLGVGAAITLAAWTDQEWATGDFASGTFSIEGSTDGVTYSEHATDLTAAVLNFAVGADALAPNDEVYAGYAVQLTAGSTNGADVEISTDTSTAIAGTSASFVYTTDATCDATAFAAGSDAGAASFSLTAVEAPTYLCFQVAAGTTLAQGQTGAITWTFTATSTAAL